MFRLNNSKAFDDVERLLKKESCWCYLEWNNLRIPGNWWVTLVITWIMIMIFSRLWRGNVWRLDNMEAKEIGCVLHTWFLCSNRIIKSSLDRRSSLYIHIYIKALNRLIIFWLYWLRLNPKLTPSLYLDSLSFLYCLVGRPLTDNIAIDTPKAFDISNCWLWMSKLPGTTRSLWIVINFLLFSYCTFFLFFLTKSSRRNLLLS